MKCRLNVLFRTASLLTVWRACRRHVVPFSLLVTCHHYLLACLCSNNTKYVQFSQSSPWTMEQWQKASAWQRALYRFAFTPLGFILVLPFSTFVILHRFVARWYEHVLDVAFWVIMWYVARERRGRACVGLSSVGVCSRVRRAACVPLCDRRVAWMHHAGVHVHGRVRVALAGLVVVVILQAPGSGVVRVLDVLLLRDGRLLPLPLPAHLRGRASQEAGALVVL